MSIFDHIFSKLNKASDTDQKIDVLIEHLKPKETPKAIQTPNIEKDNTKFDLKSVFDDGIPLHESIFIVYNDGIDETKRMVTVKRIQTRDDGDCNLICYCHEREAPRTFVLSRIVEIADPYSGESIADPLYFFKGRYGNPDLKNLKETLLNIETSLFILIFIGKCDGTLKKSERDLIFQFMNDKSIIPLNKEVVDKELKRMNCMVDEFRKYLKKANETLSIESKNELIFLTEKIINVDKEIDPMEEASLIIMKNILSLC
jgi:predicted DNA-binding transcriptional regulator YafY